MIGERLDGAAQVDPGHSFPRCLRHRDCSTSAGGNSLPELFGCERVDPCRSTGQDGIHRDLRIDRDGLNTVPALRTKYAQPRKELTDIERYIDAGFLKRL